MKNFLFSLGALLCVLCIGPASAAEKPEPNYVDAATLTLVNKPHATKQPFHRVEVADYPDLSKTVRLYYTYSTGVAVVFRTDSRTISARWTTTDRKPSTHMTGLSQKEWTSTSSATASGSSPASPVPVWEPTTRPPSSSTWTAPRRSACSTCRCSTR